MTDTKLRIVRGIYGNWIVCDWMALSAHKTEAEAEIALKRYQANTEPKQARL